MLVICLLNNIVLRGRGFCTSSIAQITGNVPRLLEDIVVLASLKFKKLLELQRKELRTSFEHVNRIVSFVYQH